MTLGGLTPARRGRRGASHALIGRRNAWRNCAGRHRAAACSDNENAWLLQGPAGAKHMAGGRASAAHTADTHDHSHRNRLNELKAGRERVAAPCDSAGGRWLRRSRARLARHPLSTRMATPPSKCLDHQALSGPGHRVRGDTSRARVAAPQRQPAAPFAGAGSRMERYSGPEPRAAAQQRRLAGARALPAAGGPAATPRPPRPRPPHALRRARAAPSRGRPCGCALCRVSPRSARPPPPGCV